MLATTSRPLSLSQPYTYTQREPETRKKRARDRIINRHALANLTVLRIYTRIHTHMHASFITRARRDFEGEIKGRAFFFIARKSCPFEVRVSLSKANLPFIIDIKVRFRRVCNRPDGSTRGVNGA